MTAPTTSTALEPKILVFSTDVISDPGIDLAGSTHLHYPPTAHVLSVPCSSGIKPRWILEAVNRGFDGVFVAADGTECPFLEDCTARTGKIIAEAQDLLRNEGHPPERLRMAAICSVCAESFTTHVNNFYRALTELGPVGDRS
jgi:coenzyme F420-reducing hydrogenase delta subunit